MKLYEKYLKLYLYFLVFFVPLVFVLKAEEAYYLPKVVLLATAVQFAFAPKKIKFDAFDWLLAAYLVFSNIGLSIMNVKDPAGVFLNFSATLGAVCACRYIRYSLSESERNRAIVAGIASAVAASFYALAQAFKYDLKGWATDFSGRSFSSMGNPDFFGGFLVLVIPLTLALYYIFDKKKLSVAVFIFLAAVLFLSQTRSSLAAFGLTVALMLVFFRDYFLKNAIPLALAGLAAALFFILTGRLEGLIDRLRVISMNNTDLQGRVSMWLAGGRMIAGNFLAGIGQGNIKSLYCLYKGPGGYFETDHLHNDFIETFAEGGVAAFAVLITMLVFAGRSLLKNKGAMPKIIFISLCGMLAQACFNFPFYIMDTKFYFFAMLGTGLGARKGPAEGEAGRAGVALSAAAFGITAVIMLRLLAGSIYLNYGINANLARDPGAGYFLKQAEKLYAGPKKYNFLADWSLVKRDIPAARAYLAKYLEALPFSKTGNIQAGIVCAEAGDLKGAETAFNWFLEYYPGDVDALNNKAKVLYMQGRAKESIAVFKEVLDNDPADVTAHNNLEAVYINGKMLKEAEVEQKRFEGLKRK